MVRQLCIMAATGIWALMANCSPYGKQISALSGKNLEKKRNAAYQLSTLDRVDGKMLPELLAAFDDTDAIVREFAIKTIGKMDPHLEEVPKAIRRGLQDPDISVRRAAAAIFSSMNPVPSEVLPTLAERLGDNDSLLRSFVKSTFIDLGPVGVNALVNACRSQNTDLRCCAVTMLGTIGCDAKRALPALQSMLNDASDQVRTAARQSIDQIQYSYLCMPPSGR